MNKSDLNSALKYKIDRYINDYIAQNNEEPKYLCCQIKWNDDNSCGDVIVKLSSDFLDDEDDQVFFCLNGYADIQHYLTEGMEDFIITDIYQFCESLN